MRRTGIVWESDIYQKQTNSMFKGVAEDKGVRMPSFAIAVAIIDRASRVAI